MERDTVELIGHYGAIYRIPEEYVPADRKYAAIAHDGDAGAMMIKNDGTLSGYGAFEKGILRLSTC